MFNKINILIILINENNQNKCKPTSLKQIKDRYVQLSYYKMFATNYLRGG